MEKPALLIRISIGPCLLMMVESWASRSGEDTSRGSQEALGKDIISLTASEDEAGLRDVAVNLCFEREAMALAKLRPSPDEQPVIRKCITDDGT